MLWAEPDVTTQVLLVIFYTIVVETLIIMPGTFLYMYLIGGSDT